MPRSGVIAMTFAASVLLLATGCAAAGPSDGPSSGSSAGSGPAPDTPEDLVIGEIPADVWLRRRLDLAQDGDALRGLVHHVPPGGRSLATLTRSASRSTSSTRTRARH
jgi:hypothetical protein